MKGYLDNLNESQRQAVNHFSGPLLIVAGAGTGKTTVITSKIAYLVLEQGIKPEEILALTFTDKAASEMEERVDRLLPLGYSDLWISTFHAFAERILKDHALEIGLPNEFKLLNQTQQWLLARKNLDRFKLRHYRPLGNPTKFIHALLKLFSRAKDENISPADYQKFVEEIKADPDKYVLEAVGEKELSKLSTDEVRDLTRQEIAKQEEIAEAYAAYQDILLENNALDFGDLINSVLKLFNERKAVLAKYRNQFKYILVDEFQDTNYSQYELVKLLSAPDNNLTVVGDDDQAIYKFRGASVSNIMQFKDDFPEAQEILLNDNYRSSQGILDLSYNFIQRNNPDRLEIKLAQNGRQLSKRLVSHAERSAEILHLHGLALNDEVEAVVNKIISLYNADKEAQWSDFAILTRANSSAEDFIWALEAAKIPYSFLASKGLYRKPIILDVLAWFRLLDSYHESRAMFRVLNFPIWSVSAVDISHLNHYAARKGVSLYDACLAHQEIIGLSKNFQPVIDKISALLQAHADLARQDKKPTEILQDYLEKTGILRALTVADSAENHANLNYLNQFHKKIQKFEKEDPAPNLANFMVMIEMELEAGEEGSLAADAEQSGPDTVKIMTIHGSKGLEFPYVFIVNLVDKKFPSINRSEPIELPSQLIKEILPEGDAHLAEERRLFYVAMTRAKTGLYFSSAEDYGGARAKKLSRFLTELSEDGFALNEKPIGEPAKQQAEQREPKPIEPGSQIQSFSYTQLKDFESCPYRYRYSHVLKLPTRGRHFFSFGTSMHAAMQKFFILARQKLADKKLSPEEAVKSGPTWDEFEKIYEQSFISDWYENKSSRDEYYEKGLESIKTFYGRWLQNPVLAEALEREFTYKISADCALKGKIDRYDRTLEGIRIVDYKTGEPKAKLSSEDKEQLLIYQLAAEEVYGEKVVELAFYYMDGGQELSFLGQPKELEKLRDKITGIVEDIRRGEFAADPDKEKCKWCDYKNICDFAI